MRTFAEEWALWPKFKEQYDSLEVLWFKPQEWLYLGPSHHDPTHPAHGLNSYPPEELWGNCFKTAQVADVIREDFGAPIHITSAFRNLAYNKAVGGVRNSLHRKFSAGDLLPLNGRVDLLHMLADAHIGNDGGVGLYSSFVHIDTRGERARWP